MKGLTKRGGTWHLRRRRPARYASVEPRGTVWVSLHTDSESAARQKAEATWANLIEAWEALLAGDSGDAERRYAAAREIAARRGFGYLEMDRLAAAPAEERVARVEAVGGPHHDPDPVEGAALLGTVPVPQLTISAALEAYWTLARERTFGKSKDQLRRWRNPRMKAVRNFTDVAGDKPLDKITRDDLLDFRQAWLDRIEAGEATANSANKDVIHLSDVLKTVNSMKRLGLDLPLGGLSFKETDGRTRPPFSEDWIRDRLLAHGALDGLNAQARAILLGMVNTGIRPSEGAGLTGDTIRLDADVPHISIEPAGRQLKSAHARRKIPLLGVSLDAFRTFPDGFSRYRESNAGLSAAVNKYLRANGLLESPDHSMYSLRHSFEDRMLAHGIDDRVRRDLFGHRLDRERYGAGASLAHLRDLLGPLAI
jgi:integrase